MATTTSRRNLVKDMDKELYTPEEAYELTMKDIKAIYDDACHAQNMHE